MKVSELHYDKSLWITVGMDDDVLLAERITPRKRGRTVSVEDIEAMRREMTRCMWQLSARQVERETTEIVGKLALLVAICEEEGNIMRAKEANCEKA